MIIFIKNYSKNKNKMTFNQTNAPAIVATTNNDIAINVNTATVTTAVNNTVTYPRMFDRWNLPL
jgi:nicotinamide mononucleotide adenylyltransferase